MPHWMTKAFKELVDGFGFHYHTAPGEAEAELAYMNRIHAVDAVLTVDSDAFLFGAPQILRMNVKNAKEKDVVEVYTADALAAQPNPNAFSPAALLFLAVVCGGDYDTIGLKGCGPITASALASGPLAQQLFNAAHEYDENMLKIFLKEWRISLCNELEHDYSGHIGRKHPKVAANVSDAFPDPKVLKLYSHPLTSESQLGNLVHSNQWFIPEVPDNSKLAATCGRLFGWGPTIASRFVSNIWDGYFIRKFIQLSSFSPIEHTQNDVSALKSNIRFMTRAKSSRTFVNIQLTMWIDALAAEAATSVVRHAGTHPSSIEGLSTTIQMLIWVPEPILQAFSSQKVAKFYAEHPRASFDGQLELYTPVLFNDLEFAAPSV